MTLGKAVAKLRKQAKVSTMAMHKKTHFSVSTISALENDKSDPKHGTIKQMMQAIGMPAIAPYLLSLSDDAKLHPADRIAIEKMASHYLLKS